MKLQRFEALGDCRSSARRGLAGDARASDAASTASLARGLLGGRHQGLEFNADERQQPAADEHALWHHRPAAPPRHAAARSFMMVSDYKSDYASAEENLPGARTADRVTRRRCPSCCSTARSATTIRRTRASSSSITSASSPRAAWPRSASLRSAATASPALARSRKRSGARRSPSSTKNAELSRPRRRGRSAIKRKLRQRAPILTSSRKLMATLIANLEKSRHISRSSSRFPHQPIRHEIYQERNDRFQRQFAAFAERKHVTYLDLNPERWTSSAEDFQDQVHLGTPARVADSSRPR